MDSKTGADILADAIQNPWKYGVTECALCKGTPLKVMAIFDPREAFAKRIGQPPGKKRFLVYGLCEPCSQVPDCGDRVEREMLKQMGSH